MSVAILHQPSSHSLSAGPIVVACTAPVTAPVPIPIPAHIPDPVPLSVSINTQDTAHLTVPVPVRPAFNWRNTTDRLREGLHRPLPFERVHIQQRQSVFQEIGLDGEDVTDDEEFDSFDVADIDEILPSRRPVSGVFLTNFLRLGLGDDVPTAQQSLRKRTSWSPSWSPSADSTSSVSRTWSVATATTSTTATSTSASSSGFTDRKRRWYSRLGGGGGGSLRLAHKRSILSARDFSK